MILSKIDLNTFTSKAEESNLQVIDGKLIAHKKYKVDVLSYILNKYPEVREIRFFWESRQSPVKRGVILGINVMMPMTIGLVTLKDNKIIISMDGFKFEDDSFNEYILKCNTDEKNEAYVDNDLHSLIRVKSNTGGNLVVLNVGRIGKPLYFNTSSYLETNNNVTKFKIKNCYKIDKVFDSYAIERLRMNYFTKIREIEMKLNIGTEKFEARVDLEKGELQFYSKFCIEKETQRNFLEHIHSYYNSLNDPLHASIIANAEEFLSDNYQTKVILNDREMVKKYLDLYNMIAM
jgi:hypothetical protein